MPQAPSESFTHLFAAPLAAALGRGGVSRDSSRQELRALLRGIADAWEVFGRNGDRGATGLPPESGLEDAVVFGDAAVLFPALPIVLPGIEPTLRLIYVADAIEAGPEHRAVHALFVILSPSAEAHGEVLSSLKDRLGDEAFLALLVERAPAESLLRALGRPASFHTAVAC